jgi:hypothetical protein
MATRTGKAGSSTAPPDSQANRAARNDNGVGACYVELRSTWTAESRCRYVVRGDMGRDARPYTVWDSSLSSCARPDSRERLSLRGLCLWDASSP